MNDVKDLFVVVSFLTLVGELVILFGFVQEKIEFDSFINQNLCIYALCVCIAKLVWVWCIHKERRDGQERERERGGGGLK